jgi:hypothetical protein
MIKSFDKENLKNLRSDIDSAFAQLRQKYGVSLQLGTIHFDDVKATAKLTMVAVGDPNAATDPHAAKRTAQAAEFKLLAQSFGLKPEHLGAMIKHGGDTYKLVGLNPKAPKFCVVATRIHDGRTYRLPESSIASLQSKEHKELYGITDATLAGMCSNDHAWGTVKGKYEPIGKCNRPATTSRKGFGLNSRPMPYCEQCAQLIDESRREMEAEARCS